jgi:hypothetical protein
VGASGSTSVAASSFAGCSGLLGSRSSRRTTACDLPGEIGRVSPAAVSNGDEDELPVFLLARWAARLFALALSAKRPRMGACMAIVRGSDRRCRELWAVELRSRFFEFLARVLFIPFVKKTTLEEHERAPRYSLQLRV